MDQGMGAIHRRRQRLTRDEISIAAIASRMQTDWNLCGRKILLRSQSWLVALT